MLISDLKKAVCYKNGYYEKDVLIFLESKVFQKKKTIFVAPNV